MHQLFCGVHLSRLKIALEDTTPAVRHSSLTFRFSVDTVPPLPAAMVPPSLGNGAQLLQHLIQPLSYARSLLTHKLHEKDVVPRLQPTGSTVDARQIEPVCLEDQESVCQGTRLSVIDGE